ncbi:MAG: YbhB/YbcL family Raf kinase inhibitor-like protein [Rhodoplanes sp.]|uniref:YbhB/YbcL family Raf kinase inhibitor-like protein n=1 Tax=Rhodoplanes sp. TaxID=1968906 RepID=UPI00184C59D7|nr:YbhB/YbcL family Raf kinase inhibitor-like protein [Rhodoplanes sp.]NVO15860.1 YbhB/YbcL family Raf kinase inhibitor-like protein [Rhodoplanes sp.]
MQSTKSPNTIAGAWTALACGVAIMTMLSVPAAAQANVFQLSSPAFADNGLLAKKNAGRNPANPNCVGDNVSPPLAWSNPPAGTRSYAIILHDQEGRNGLGVVHWLAYGIDASVTSLPEGAGDGQFKGLTGGKNILGQGTYFGPCPPKTQGPHHYVFTIIATDLEPTALEPGLTMPQLLEAIGSHAKAATGLIGRFGH